MRLALVGPVYPFRGGIAHYTTMLYQALRGEGHEVLLVTFKRQYPRFLFPGRSDRDPSKEPMVLPEAQRWLDSLNPLTWLATLARIRRHRPDALVLQWWTTFWAPVWLALGALNRVFLRRPLIYICHNVLPHEAHTGARWLTRMALRWGDGYVVQSPEDRDTLAALVRGAPIAVVPHPPYAMFVQKQKPKQEARQALGLPADPYILLFFGIVREYKRLGEVLDALADWRAQGKRVMLVVAGEFWSGKRRYQDSIARLRLEDAVVMHDRYIPNEEVALYFSAADALVAPYGRKEGSGAMQMAQGFGLPILRTTAASPYNTPPQALGTPESSWSALATSVAAMATPGRATRDS